MNEKIPIGNFQNPCTGDFEFDRNNNYRDFLPVLETSSLSQKIPIGNDFEFERKNPIRILRNPYRDDFESERKIPYRDFFPVLETLSLNAKNPYRDFFLYWENNLLFAP